MDVNDNAGYLNERVARAFFVGTPPGASSLLQRIAYDHRDDGVFGIAIAGKPVTVQFFWTTL
jgi:hypothetical protein